MSRRRYVSTDISTDVAVAALVSEHGPLPALLYTWAMPHADDFGRLSGCSGEFLLKVCPGLDVSVADVDQALDAVASAALWSRREEGGRMVLEFDQHWWAHNQGYTINKRRCEPWKRIRHRIAPLVFDRDGTTCLQCGSTEHLEIDHIIPIARGGTNALVNLQVLCRHCNRKKWMH